MILSVSRRTDIPAFYSSWFMNRIHSGFLYVKNTFNANQISKIPLTPDIVDFIVFWSKNPEPLLKFLPEIQSIYGNAFYFQYTINGYERDVEPEVPNLSDRIQTLMDISKKYGKKSVVWRYDPIFLSEKYNLVWHINRFSNIFEQVKPYIDTCVISFIDTYSKTLRNTRHLYINSLTKEDQNLFAEKFSGIIKNSNISLKTCSEEINLDAYKIKHNSCIDKERIESISGYKIKAELDKQRDYCQCIKCVDIGQYNTCSHGCKYCYANYNQEKVQEAIAAHLDDSPLLTGDLPSNCKITVHGKAKSIKISKIGTKFTQDSLI